VNVDGLPDDDTNGLTGPGGTCSVGNLMCRAYNWGRNAAVFSVTYARSLGVDSAMWWLDVEIGKPWRTDDLAYNVQAIKGMLDGLRNYGYVVVIYSTKYQWGVVTGGAYSPGTPIWVPGADNLAEAERYCGANYRFDGGVTWLTQWTTTFDHDYACPV
jgi:hypothetical protein